MQGPGSNPGRDYSGRMPDSEPAMGGDLMAREWDVPGYTEVKVLGSGGFGEVVLARHDASGTAGAIKYPRGELLAGPGFAALFRARGGGVAPPGAPHAGRPYADVGGSG